MITGYPINGAMASSGGGRVWKLSMVCLPNNAIGARGILVTILHCTPPQRHLYCYFCSNLIHKSVPLYKYLYR